MKDLTDHQRARLFSRYTHGNISAARARDLLGDRFFSTAKVSYESARGIRSASTKQTVRA
jgi:hypothetical protein